MDNGMPFNRYVYWETDEYNHDGLSIFDTKAEMPYQEREGYMVILFGVKVPLTSWGPETVTAFIEDRTVSYILSQPGHYLATQWPKDSDMILVDVARIVPTEEEARALMVRYGEQTYYDLKAREWS